MGNIEAERYYNDLRKNHGSSSDDQQETCILLIQILHELRQLNKET